MTIIDELDDFIKNTQNAQEVKRALAVKMILTGTSYHEIENLLQVSHSFISKWKNQALFHGVDSLKLQYKGSKSYLKPSSRAVVIEWLREQDYLRLGDLKRYLEQEHKVVYASDQSYYALFKEAGISWKKTQKRTLLRMKKKFRQKKKKLKES